MRISATTLMYMLLISSASAQPGPPTSGGPPRPGAAATNGSTVLVTRMLKFDQNSDQQLTLDEVTDARLHRLFRRADVDQDGTVTTAELTALAAAITAEFPNAGRRGGPGGPRGGGPGGRPPGGPPPRRP